MGRAVYLTAALLAISCTWSGVATAKTVVLSGDFVQESPGAAVCTPDPQDQTFADCFFTAGTATLTGTWIGQNLTEGTGRINIFTGETTGAYSETFTGTAATGGIGTVRSRGTFTVGPVDHQTGAQEFRVEARIIGGSGDFAGSHGQITFTGTLVGGAGNGTYEGRWVLPGSGAAR